MLRAVASISVASASAASLPCDIYAADGAPCVAAHSLTRALFAASRGYARRMDADTHAESDIARP
jgi:hypothetical protein